MGIIRSYVAYFNASEGRARATTHLQKQRMQVAGHVQTDGGVILQEFIEIQVGTERPELWQAFALARKSESVMVFPSLSALYNSGKFVDALVAARLEFVVVDNPIVDSSTIKVLLTAGEYQAKVRSQRARESLQAAKARGVKLGSARPDHWRGKKKLRNEILKAARQRSMEVRKARAKAANSVAIKRVLKLHASSLNPTQIARILNDEGIKTRRGKTWSCIQVQRLLTIARHDANQEDSKSRSTPSRRGART